MTRIILPFILVTSLILIVSIATSHDDEYCSVDDNSDSELVPLFSNGFDYLDDPMKYERFGASIGIVFGHSHFRVGVERNGQMEFIPNDLGNTKTPNWISFTNNGTILVGDDAKNQANLNPKSTIFDVKRLLGRKFDDPEVQREIRVSQYKIVNKEEKPYVEIKFGGETKLFSPEEMVAIFMRKIKDMAENHLRKRIRKAIITVPDYIDGEQKFALDLVAQKVGFRQTRVPSSRMVSLVAHNMSEVKGERNCLVFHLSVGACEVNIVVVENGVFDFIAQRVDTNLGGKEIDQRVVNYFIGLIKNKYGRDIIGELDETALERLVKECERAKIALSSHEEVVLEIESLFEGVNFSETLTRKKFEELNADLFEKTMALVESALEEAKLKKEDINDIILVGGSSRIPKVQRLLKDLFDGKEPSNAARVNPDEVLLKGVLLFPHLEGGPYEIMLIDMIPMSVGIQTVGGVVTKMIPRHSLYPRKRKELFTTNRDNQSTVEIKVYNGEMRFAKDCREIGRFNLTGIRPAPRGVPQIEISFRIDEYGALYVKAVDKASNISASSKPLPTSSGYDSNEEIEVQRMLEESVELEDRMYWLTKSHNCLSINTAQAPNSVVVV